MAGISENIFDIDDVVSTGGSLGRVMDLQKIVRIAKAIDLGRVMDLANVARLTRDASRNFDEIKQAEHGIGDRDVRDRIQRARQALETIIAEVDNGLRALGEGARGANGQPAPNGQPVTARQVHIHFHVES